MKSTGNVLVIGNSGVGKSTLINAFLGDEETAAVTGWGTKGTTDELKIYTAERVPFQLVDTVGFEPALLRRKNAIDAVRKWSKESAKEGNEEQRIDAIWFCVDGMARKLFEQSIKDLTKATKMWKSVPVIVVITKSYSIPERDENIQMVRSAFAQQKRRASNLKAVVPVVAHALPINDTTFVAPDGIDRLIEETNKVLPEGSRAAEWDVASFRLQRKRSMAQGTILVSTAAGAAVGTIPLPFADAVILGPVEASEVMALRRIYGIPDDDASQKVMDAILEIGTASVVAKAAISALKAVPGVNIAAEVLNAVVAGAIVAAIGEGAALVFEKVHLGEIDEDDLDRVRKLVEEKLDKSFVSSVAKLIEQIANDPGAKKSAKEIATMILGAVAGTPGKAIPEK